MQQSLPVVRAPVQQARQPVNSFVQQQQPERDNTLLQTQPRLIASTPQPEYEYIEYYEYYDEEEEEEEAPVAVHKPPVKTIGDYDLFPLVNKVCVITIKCCACLLDMIVNMSSCLVPQECSIKYPYI